MPTPNQISERLQNPRRRRRNFAAWSRRCLTIFGLSLFFASWQSVHAQDEIETAYGGLTGTGRTSINGYGAFAEMIRQSKIKIEQASSLTPYIDEFDTIVWIPNSFNGPEPKVAKRLYDWLGDGKSRRLIIIGRDFDATPLYWKNLCQPPITSSTADYRRRLAEAISNQRFQRRNTILTHLSCRFFTLVESPQSKRAQTLSGPWSANLDARQSAIFPSGQLLPPEPSKARAWGRPSEILLSCDGIPFVFRHIYRSSFYQSEAIVVANGSFLTNFGLVNKENRKLAQRLIQNGISNKSVLVIQSDENGLKALSQEEYQRRPNVWTWMQNRPLCYILPHFLVLGIMFCFVYFPIFGRPQKVDPPSNSDFGDHIDATAQLLKKTQDTQRMRQQIAVAKNLLRQETKH